MRGIHDVNIFYSNIFRITPACAGNTRITERPDNFNEDHPRVCGEYYYEVLK